MPPTDSYRGRLAPTPTGYLHLGHARTFWIAWRRCRERGGTLVYRNEDLDRDRCRSEFADAAREDLRWFGLDWQEGPDIGGPHAPYNQSQRLDWYREVWRQLQEAGAIYPSPHSRRDVQSALQAPHAEDEEPIFPPSLRPAPGTGGQLTSPGDVNWRFRVPDGEVMTFSDGRCGETLYRAGMDFGDFLVWRKDGFPSYELAVVADDHAMEITEVVRGEDLLKSTARQLLVYRALGWTPPMFYHCELLCDATGRRLAKRDRALSLRELRATGKRPEQWITAWTDELQGAE